MVDISGHPNKSMDLRRQQLLFSRCVVNVNLRVNSFSNFMRVLLRALAVWFIIVCLESVLGTLRTLFLAPLVGDFRALQIGVFVSIFLILAVAYLSIEWIQAHSIKSLIFVGVIWLVLIVLFELSLGFTLELSWARIAEDYDIRHGGLMPFGLVFMAFSPLIVAKLRRQRTNDKMQPQ